jgi:hypothetical protein
MTQPRPPYPPPDPGYPGYPGYPPGPPAAPMPPAPPPGRRGTTWLVVAIAALAVVAVGTIGYVVVRDDDTGIRTDLTLADLEPALLTADQVPDGFTEEPWAEGDGDDLGADDVEASEACERVLASLALADSAGDEIGVSYERGTDDASIEHTLGVAGPDDLDVDGLQAAINSCREFAYDDGESSGTMTMSAEPVGGIGDDALLLVVRVQAETGGYQVDVEMTGILFERDGVHASLGYSGGFDEADVLGGGSVQSKPVDRAELRALAEAADRNLDGVV